ncbi:MAG: cytochrome-c peroxidase [Methylovirgula sp.]
MFLSLRSLLVSALLPLSMAASGAEKAPDSIDAGLRQQYVRPSATPYPDDDPYSPAKETLGRALFFDHLLSGSGTHSCATCHSPSLSFGDRLPRAVGDAGRPMAVRSPTLLDVGLYRPLRLDRQIPDT